MEKIINNKAENKVESPIIEQLVKNFVIGNKIVQLIYEIDEFKTDTNEQFILEPNQEITFTVELHTGKTYRIRIDVPEEEEINQKTT